MCAIILVTATHFGGGIGSARGRLLVSNIKLHSPVVDEQSVNGGARLRHVRCAARPTLSRMKIGRTSIVMDETFIFSSYIKLFCVIMYRATIWGGLYSRVRSATSALASAQSNTPKDYVVQATILVYILPFCIPACTTNESQPLIVTTIHSVYNN